MFKDAQGWLKGFGLLPLTLLGLILYICLAAPATIFYTRLGTTPGEVGITYTGLLSSSLLGIIAMIIALAVIFAIISFVVWLAGADVWKSIRRFAWAILAFLAAAILIFPSLLAFWQAGQVKNGNDKYLGQQFGMFGYRAQLVSIGPAPGDTKQINDVRRVITTPASECYPRIFLLGQNSQYVILYLSVDHRTARVPTSLVIVKSPPYPTTCAKPTIAKPQHSDAIPRDGINLA